MNIIRSIRYDGVTCVLCDAATRKPLEKGAEVTSFRGERMRLAGGQAPHKPAASGYVDVRHEGDVKSFSYYPVVINAVWLGEGEVNI